jgi:phosphate transport system permease protein
VIPTARAGLTTAVILGIALGVGETAPLILTTSNSVATNYNPFHGPQSSLTLFIKSYVLLPNHVQQQRGFATAVVLVLLVGVLFVLARYTAGRSARRLGRK